MPFFRPFCVAVLFLWIFGVQAAPTVVQFNSRSARNGKWSDPATWAGKKIPQSGDNIQIRPGHEVTYDVKSASVRVLHVAGTLTFARDKSTQLEVGLLKIQPGEE